MAGCGLIRQITQCIIPVIEIRIINYPGIMKYRLFSIDELQGCEHGIINSLAGVAIQKYHIRQIMRREYIISLLDVRLFLPWEKFPAIQGIAGYCPG